MYLCRCFLKHFIANKLINYRIAQLEKKVEKHNNIIERTFKLESGLEDLKEEVHMFHKG